MLSLARCDARGGPSTALSAAARVAPPCGALHFAEGAAAGWHHALSFAATLADANAALASL